MRFCPQCGTQINDDAVFCRKCGAKQRVETQPQQPVQSQAPVQQTVQQIQPQPRVQQPVQPQQPVQQQQMYGQPQMQQPMYGQPQMQQPMYGQPQMQQQMYGQPQMQQQMYGQPQMQQQMYGQPQRQQHTDGQQPRKKSPAGLILGIVGGCVAIVALAIILAVSGIFKDTKTLYAEQVVGFSENISNELPEIGMGPIRAFLHLDKDDADDSHTTTRTTTIESEMLGDQTFEMVQSYSYDKSSGDTAYDITVNAGDSPLGTGTIYFNDSEFLYVPMNTSSPMVRYEMDSDTVNSLEEYAAVDRYALMLSGDTTGGTDWNQAKKDFLEDTLAAFDKKDFVKGKEAFTIFGREEQCSTISLQVSGDQAEDLLNAVNKLIVNDIVSMDEEDENKTNLFGSINGSKSDEELESVILTTFVYKKTPVAMRIEASTDADDYVYEMSCYQDGVERQMIFNTRSGSGKNDAELEDSVISMGGSNYLLTTKADYGSFTIFVEEEGTIKGDNRNLSGTFEIAPGKGSKVVGVSLGDSITGTLSETFKDGDGEYYTEYESDQGIVGLRTVVERGALNKDKITPPAFIDESGTDCGDDHEELLDAMGMKRNQNLVKVDNTMLRTGNAIALMLRDMMRF
ncbi:MAG: zinc-ribbon domain-containing protein [Lachnospiraceae bacterium]|nr:zinc-ribbon domain-containing protein [Lachnospiraceae bacterium]